MLKTILFISAFVVTSAVPAQTVSGSWYGRADVVVEGVSSNYLTEFILKQKGNDVEGIFGYYFKNSYQSFFVRGLYNPKTRQLSFRNLPLLFYASPARNGIECPMDFQGTLMVSKVNSSVNGIFSAIPKYQYTCPQLRVVLTMNRLEKNQDSVLKASAGGKTFWQPQEEDMIVSAASVSTKADTIPVAYTAMSNSAGSSASDSHATLIEEFGKRNNIYEKDIVINDDSVLVSFYDNGDIDDDTISVFLNRKPILVNRGLSSRALNIYIGLDSNVAVNELSMFADNLGKFPPNTALMVVSDGQLRYEFYLSASLKQNSSVRLRRGKPKASL